ncbi:protein TolQ [Salinispirillum sp. LH 10-3-1]|uniref:Tol-Pal system protein TolQ n=2 Tax=Salinispirillum sp. LH 10-3-1 TaxID=2952525 RepID=A0AB38YDF5_9GAMM
MHNDMSYWSLIASASLLVQLVMLTLLLLSVFSWFFIFERVQFLSRASRSNENFEERFWSGMDLTQLFRQVNANPDPDSGSEAIFRAGFKEFTRARQQSDMDPEATMTAIQRAMRVATNKEEDKLDNHLSFLATVGSISPYIGLFGTVWGIMNSFRELGNAAQATLATVAPGIAEALIATAMGLFAAIPAVVAYNKFSNRAENLIGLYETFSEEFSSILHRQVHALSRKTSSQSPKARTESSTESAPKPLGDAGLA